MGIVMFHLRSKPTNKILLFISCVQSVDTAFEAFLLHYVPADEEAMLSNRSLRASVLELQSGELLLNSSEVKYKRNIWSVFDACTCN